MKRRGTLKSQMMRMTEQKNTSTQYEIQFSFTPSGGDTQTAHTDNHRGNDRDINTNSHTNVQDVN